MKGIFLKSLKKDLERIDPEYAEIFNGHERVYSPEYLNQLVGKLIANKSYINSEWYILYRLAQLNKLESMAMSVEELKKAYLSALTEETLEKFPFASRDKKLLEEE